MLLVECNKGINKKMKGHTEMTNSKKRNRRITASLLTAFFLVQQSMIAPDLATNITGVTGTNGTYNISPTAVNGQTGFRQYQDFDLSAGDIANLIYKKRFN